MPGASLDDRERRGVLAGPRVQPRTGPTAAGAVHTDRGGDPAPGEARKQPVNPLTAWPSRESEGRENVSVLTQMYVFCLGTEWSVGEAP